MLFADVTTAAAATTAAAFSASLVIAIVVAVTTFFIVFKSHPLHCATVKELAVSRSCGIGEEGHEAALLVALAVTETGPTSRRRLQLFYWGDGGWDGGWVGRWGG
jgi:hypothetical protein